MLKLMFIIILFTTFGCATNYNQKRLPSSDENLQTLSGSSIQYCTTCAWNGENPRPAIFFVKNKEFEFESCHVSGDVLWTRDPWNPKKYLFSTQKTVRSLSVTGKMKQSDKGECFEITSITRDEVVAN